MLQDTKQYTEIMYASNTNNKRSRKELKNPASFMMA